MVLDLVADIWNVTEGDVEALMQNRVIGRPYDESNAWNLAWRVFYDLKNHRKAQAERGDVA